MTDEETAARLPRVRVFVDYWNFQLTLNESCNDDRVKIDWKRLGAWLAEKACARVGIEAHTYEGCIVYTSYDAQTEQGKKYHGWVTSWLDRQPGVTVKCRKRRAKHPPKCPKCHKTITDCPHCSQKLRGTVEKGVDTLIATDMIRLAWEEAYDIAVLATVDADLVPAVEFLDLRARKVIQAGFPPKGIELAAACWASFDVVPDCHEIRRDLP